MSNASGRRRGLKTVRCDYCSKKTRRPNHVNVSESSGIGRMQVCQRCMRRRGWTDEQWVEVPP